MAAAEIALPKRLRIEFFPRTREGQQFCITKNK